METHLLKKQPSHIELSDWTIIQNINNPSKREESFNEFYRRYKGFVLKVCKKSCSSFDSSDNLAYDIFQNTFIKINNNLGSFKSKDSTDDITLKKEIMLWLSRIAKNEFINFLRENPDEKALSNRNRPRIEDIEESISEKTSDDENSAFVKPETLIQKNILDIALGQLSDRERYILMTYMQFFDPSNPLNHIPDKTMSHLCTNFNIKSENIRQIKTRALKKLKKILITK